VAGIDFNAIFALTIYINSLYILLAVIALENLEAHQVDINNAFIEAVLKEKIYIKLPDKVEVDKGNI
jgi:hypothetical protein